MKSKLVSLRLKKEIEKAVEVEQAQMQLEQPWHKVTFSMAVRSLIYEGLTYRDKLRALND